MRELLKENQYITIVPQDFKNSNKGKVLNVDQDGFKMELKYKPEGIIANHICDFYSLTDNGYLYFESYIKALEDNIVSIANPVKHRFLQRRKFTRVKFTEDLELKYNDTSYKVHSLDISAGGMKLQTKENINLDNEYKVVINLGSEQEVKCKYQVIRVERDNDGLYTISGRFTNISNVDKMTLIQFCMKKDMENSNK